MSGAAVDTWITPDWPAHPRVGARITTRHGDVSPPPWRGFNLGTNCDDQLERVQHARTLVADALNMAAPAWLNQVHGTRIIDCSDPDRVADGCVTTLAATPCVVLTADCLPVLMARQDGSAVGAFHAGWRGLLDGIVELGVERLAPDGEPLDVWLGPAICQGCYQVDNPVRDAFLAESADAVSAFIADGENYWRMDLLALARARLARCGQYNIYGGQHCTHCQAELFYSFRYEGQTGRFASLIWLNN